MYVIKGCYLNSAWEDIDEFETQEDAEKMLAEYRMAFDSDWLLIIRKRFHATEGLSVNQRKIAESDVVNEYDKLVLAEKTCHTIEIREKATGKEGVANTCTSGVQVFYGADDGGDDKIISPEIFSRDFEITAEIAN